jgi:hypothetical protein
MEKIYKALYPEHGGPAQGFMCGSCPRVLRTRIGMLRHLWRKHKIKVQLSIDFKDNSKEELESMAWLDQ